MPTILGISKPVSPREDSPSDLVFGGGGVRVVPSVDISSGSSPYFYIAIKPKFNSVSVQHNCVTRYGHHKM